VPMTETNSSSPRVLGEARAQPANSEGEEHLGNGTRNWPKEGPREGNKGKRASLGREIMDLSVSRRRTSRTRVEQDWPKWSDETLLGVNSLGRGKALFLGLKARKLGEDGGVKNSKNTARIRGRRPSPRFLKGTKNKKSERRG